MEYTFEAEVGGKTLSIKSGKVAKQASGSVVVQCGETAVLVTVVSAAEERPDMGFFPLTVEYQEKIYSAGRIPGNYFRREIGRPSEKEILTCRLTDRPIRPLFPKDFKCETQVISTVISMDKENDPDVLAMMGAFSALYISDIPFEGPIAAVRVGRIDGEFIINPTIEQCLTCDINITVAGSRTGVIMVEGGGAEASEAEMLDAIFHAHTALQPLIDLQEKLREACGKEKRVVIPKEKDEALQAKVDELAAAPLRESMRVPVKQDRNVAVRAVKAQLIADLGEDYADRGKEVGEAFQTLLKTISRKVVLEENTRIDGRAFDEVRAVTCEVGPLERPHGSALFTRGETQVLGTLTLGSGRDEQRVETLSGEDNRPFMLHYNFPPFSVGECRRMGGPSRRDIGHGNLASRALERILPEREDFEYTVRIVGEVLESNGSSSMGTVCAGTLALMDGGVPIKAPVSGIAMGLVTDGEKTVILSDILGDEDHTGDMDFKVAGTENGITALQMDIKVKEISREVLEGALSQARVGRLHILTEMLKTLDKSRDDISPYAPKVLTVKINPDKIRDLIGPGGKMIRAIQSDTNTTLEVDDTGLVKISAFTQEEGDAALQIVTDIGTDPEIGAIYEGKVAKTTDFGAFVTLKPGTDGLVHISELAKNRVRKVTDVVREGDMLKVKVLEISRDGKIRLSHKATLEDK